MLIHILSILQAGKKGENALQDLQYTGFPPDPDTDGDFDKDSIRALKALLGKELIDG